MRGLQPGADVRIASHPVVGSLRLAANRLGVGQVSLGGDGLLIAGAFLDLTAIMLIVVPLAMPLILQLGVDPVHFGIVVVVNLMLGGLTPPYCLLVFIPSAITGTSVQATFRAVMPFFLILVFGLALITYVPSISLAFVRAFF